MNISEPIMRAIEDLGFIEATEIQAKAIPVIKAGEDVIGKSQTGTGKTLAFGIPALELVDSRQKNVQVLILCPTRELAMQASGELKKLSKYMQGIACAEVYGGAPMERQIIQLKKANVVVGTPGRVMDHMRRRTLKLAELRMKQMKCSPWGSVKTLKPFWLERSHNTKQCCFLRQCHLRFYALHANSRTTHNWWKLQARLLSSTFNS